MPRQPAGPGQIRRFVVDPRRYSPALSLITSAVLVISLAACGEDNPEAEIALPDPSATNEPTGEPTPDKPTDDAQADDSDGESDSAERDEDKSGGEWVNLTDKASGARFALPSKVEPRENTATVQDGSDVSLRNYATQVGDGVVEVGFNIIDTPGASYDLEAGVDGVASTLEGEVVASSDTEVDGHAAVDVEISYGEDMLVLFQLIRAGDHVMQTLASGPQSDRETVEATYQELNESLEVN